MKIWLSALLLALAVGCGEHTPAPSAPSLSPTLAVVDDALARRVDRVLDLAITEGRIVGTVVLVAKDGKIVYHAAKGFADREAKQPMREDTFFRFSSVTKPIVSATALALVERGTLGLDDPVTKWLPEFRPRLADGRAPIITVRHLLSHTAGLNYGFSERADGPYHRERVSDGFDQPGLSLEENLARLTRAPLLFEPGSKWNYSLATDVLGGVIAKAGGAPLPEVVRRLVTGPLDSDASFSPPAANRLATPYADGKPAPTRMTDPQGVPFLQGTLLYSPSRIWNPASYPSGGAGMLGTAAGYLKFLEAVRTGGGKILRSESVALMTQNQVGDLDVLQSGGTFGWGLGFSVLKKPAPNMPWAAGTFEWGGVWGHNFWVDPSAKLTTIIFTNTAIAGMIGEFPDAVRDAIYGVK